GAFEGLFRQHFLVCPFAQRDRIFWIDTDIWPAACIDTDPTSCLSGSHSPVSRKRGLSMTRCKCESTSQATKFSRTVTTGSASKRGSCATAGSVNSAALATIERSVLIAAYLWHRRPTFLFERFERPSMAEASLPCSRPWRTTFAPILAVSADDKFSRSA